jgi:hypothetical protein
MNNITKLVVYCNKHNIEWIVRYQNFTQSNSGCPVCKESKGELIIRKYLTDNNISFISQKTFKGCKNTRILPFDFYIPTINTCIEFDGKQHFSQTNKWGGELSYLKILENDEIKNVFCKNNNINLLRISYKEDILSKLINMITL